MQSSFSQNYFKMPAFVQRCKIWILNFLTVERATINPRMAFSIYFIVSKTADKPRHRFLNILRMDLQVFFLPILCWCITRSITIFKEQQCCWIYCLHLAVGQYLFVLSHKGGIISKWMTCYQTLLIYTMSRLERKIKLLYFWSCFWPNALYISINIWDQIKRMHKYMHWKQQINSLSEANQYNRCFFYV